MKYIDVDIPAITRTLTNETLELIDSQEVSYSAKLYRFAVGPSKEEDLHLLVDDSGGITAIHHPDSTRERREVVSDHMMASAIASRSSGKIVE